MQVRTKHLSIRKYIEREHVASAEEGVAVRAALFRFTEDLSKITTAITLLSTLNDLDRLRIQDPESPQIVKIRSTALAALTAIEQSKSSP